LRTACQTDNQAARLTELQAEMAQANAEYKDALAEAEALLGELRDTLKVTLGDGTERNVPSLKNAVAAM
jgi:mediator of RNA polymerase II transcription subunit 21